jgi:DNA-binding XRE family transcriptional regulator
VKGGLAYIVFGDGLMDLQEREARRIDRAFRSALIQALRRDGQPAWMLSVVEATGGFHVNIVCPRFPGIDRFRKSATYGFALAGKKAIQLVNDPRGLRNYLAAERTSQAKSVWGVALGPRVPGSHRLETKASGDRVKVSKDLQREMEKAGQWQPFKQSYAKPLALPAPLPKPQPLETVTEASGQIALVLGKIDNPIAAAEAKRRTLGIRQEDLAERLGIARPTLANAAAGRYRLSDWVMARAAEFLREAA